MIILGMVVNAEMSALPYYLQIFISNFVISQLLSKPTAETNSVHKKPPPNKQKSPIFFFYSDNF